MTQGLWIRRVVKPALWVAGLSPFVWLLHAAFTDGLGANPVEMITHFTGTTAVVILLLTLAITPARRLTGFNPLVKLRRLVGLFAYFYVVLHVLTFAIFDRELSLAGLGEDILERPYITVGFTVFVLLSTLAVTSPLAVVRRLGGRRWKALHRIIYVAAGLAMLHFAWAQKRDIREPLIFTAVLAVLLLLRLPRFRPRVAGADGAE